MNASDEVAETLRAAGPSRPASSERRRGSGSGQNKPVGVADEYAADQVGGHALRQKVNDERARGHEEHPALQEVLLPAVVSAAACVAVASHCCNQRKGRGAFLCSADSPELTVRGGWRSVGSRS